MALAACFLEDSVPYSTIYSRLKAWRMQGTYDGLLDDARLELGLIPIIDFTATDEEDTNTLPITINTADQSRAPLDYVYSSRCGRPNHPTNSRSQRRGLMK
jgi:hypothetical protein